MNLKMIWGAEMRVRWVSWWIASIFWFVLFVVGSIFIWLREVDGSGAVQTPELKLVAFIILLAAFVIPLIIQMVWLVINLKNNRMKNM